MSQPPIFHEASGTVRFWVLIGEEFIGASVGKETLHYRYRSTATDDEALDTYALHAQDIDDAVRRRVAQGSTEPVMLREFDLREPVGKRVE
jgi:hypothetical protein